MTTKKLIIFDLKGIVLALISCVFIGASFIIKKKGLKKAATASGLRAGCVGGYSYLVVWHDHKWRYQIYYTVDILAAFMFYRLPSVIFGEVANFVAYAFASAVLFTPLGALSIIMSAVLAHFMLNEKQHHLGILGCVMCIVGSVVIVIHAPHEQPISSVQEIWTMATQPAFLLYVGSVLILVLILVIYFAPQVGHTNVMSLKALGTSLKLTFEGSNQLIYPKTWFFVFVVAICVITQMNYLNKALDTFNTAIVSPIYYVMFTTLTIIANIIMFKDWEGQSAGNIISGICGFIVVLSGTILLLVTKDFKSSSFRERSKFAGGSYTPVSPSLSAGLCGGYGENFRFEEEEDKDYSEEPCSRNQERYA